MNSIKIADNFEASSVVNYGSTSEDALSFVRERLYSSLDRIGYTPEQIDMFTGKVTVKTDWSPHPQTGKPIYGSPKVWAPAELWIYNEWRKADRAIALSPAQIEWASRWTDNDCLEFLIHGGRDSGKSWEGALLGIYSMVFHTALFKRGYEVSLFAGAKDQTSTVYDKHVIPMIVTSNNLQEIVADNDMMWEIVARRKKAAVKEVILNFVNGSKMYINPASTKAARSKHPDLVWFDEMVEAEDVRKGLVISGAKSSLTAGHHMRFLGTSTVHKHPNGMFAQRIRRGRRLMEQNNKTVFVANLTKGGLGSKPWLSLEEHKRELTVKSGDPTINLDAEFYGEIVGGDGDAFNQEDLTRCFLNSPKPVFDPHSYHIMAHDPGFGTSYYGLVILQTDFFKVDVIYSDFWYKKSPTKIFDGVDGDPGIDDLVEQFKIDFHGCDIYGTSTIKELQERNYDVQGYAFNHKPEGWDDMLPDDKKRFGVDQNHIAVNYINELLAGDRLSLHKIAGAYKRYDRGPDAPLVYGNQILSEQMEAYQVDPQTNKFIKGSDDMVDALKFGVLPIILGHTIGGRILDAGRMT